MTKLLSIVDNLGNLGVEGGAACDARSGGARGSGEGGQQVGLPCRLDIASQHGRPSPYCRSVQVRSPDERDSQAAQSSDGSLIEFIRQQHERVLRNLLVPGAP